MNLSGTLSPDHQRLESQRRLLRCRSPLTFPTPQVAVEVPHVVKTASPVAVVAPEDDNLHANVLADTTVALHPRSIPERAAIVLHATNARGRALTAADLFVVVCLDRGQRLFQRKLMLRI